MLGSFSQFFYSLWKTAKPTRSLRSLIRLASLNRMHGVLTYFRILAVPNGSKRGTGRSGVKILAPFLVSKWPFFTVYYLFHFQGA